MMNPELASMIFSYGILKEEKERYWKRILIVDDDFEYTP
jgi:hypothetical protein